MTDVEQRLLDELGYGFLSRSGGTDVTSWDCCHRCGRADWDGHKADCSFAKALEAFKRLIEERSCQR